MTLRGLSAMRSADVALLAVYMQIDPIIEQEEDPVESPKLL